MQYLRSGEREAVKRLLADAENFGYGHFIALLRAHWVEKLKREGLATPIAIKATMVEPYTPEDLREFVSTGGEAGLDV